MSSVEALQARARLAQAVALRDLGAHLRHWGRTVSAPAPRLVPVEHIDTLWQAACSGSRWEQARAAEALAVDSFVLRPPAPIAPLRSI